MIQHRSPSVRANEQSLKPTSSTSRHKKISVSYFCTLLSRHLVLSWYEMSPKGGSDVEAYGAGPQVLHHRHAITATATARQDHLMINYTQSASACRRRHSICLYVKPWWLCMHSVCNPMQEPDGKGVLPTPLEQQRNQLQAVVCVGTVQTKGGFVLKA